jgi:protein-disulfide isomerase
VGADGGAVAASATPDAPFDPFSDRPPSEIGRREVIANPSIEEIMKPGELPEMALGRPDAPVTIVQYASMTCPYCRKFQVEAFPVLKREYIDTGKVRYVLRAEFPIGKQSGLATVALRCAPPHRYFELYEKLMLQQASWVSQEVRPDPIFKVAAQVGMTRAQFDSCRENRGMIRALNAIKERGRTLGIIGTPNFFIQGKLVKSVIGIREIREMVDPILAGKVAATQSAPPPR